MSAKMETPADTNHCTEKSALWLVSVFYLNTEGRHEGEEEKAQ